MRDLGKEKKFREVGGADLYIVGKKERETRKKKGDKMKQRRQEGWMTWRDYLFEACTRGYS